jgi:hypothetical protein
VVTTNEADQEKQELIYRRALWEVQRLIITMRPDTALFIAIARILTKAVAQASGLPDPDETGGVPPGF